MPAHRFYFYRSGGRVAAIAVAAIAIALMAPGSLDTRPFCRFEAPARSFSDPCRAARPEFPAMTSSAPAAVGPGWTSSGPAAADPGWTSSAPVAADPGWMGRTAAALSSMEYCPSRTEQGLQAPNRAQGFRSWFGPERVTIAPRRAGTTVWSWSWQTHGFGREDRIEPVLPTEPVQTAARVEYPRPGWVEWYENGTAGLEQGFTIEVRPKGAGRLCIQGRVGGELRGFPASDPHGLDFRQADGATILRYGRLTAADACGRALPGAVELADGAIRILVDDRGASYPIWIDPLITSPAWEFHGDQAGVQAGRGLSTIGDVNGDGFSDFAVGMPFYDALVPDAGCVVVFHGSPSGPSPTPDWIADGGPHTVFFGLSLSTAGDVNGDGYDDLIVGAPLYTNDDGSRGRVFVYHGSASGLSDASWVLPCPYLGSTSFGMTVANAGDVNGDGFSDVIIGDYHYNGDQPDEGAAWVYCGSADGLESAPVWMGEGNQQTCYYGLALSTAGDVDSDGYGDILVGAPRHDAAGSDLGRAYFYRGSPAGLTLAAEWTVSGAGFNRFGDNVSLAGDVNGDGFADALVASLNSVHLFLGSATGLSTTEAWSRVGSTPTAYLGDGLATAGDVNGDGLADFLVAEPSPMDTTVIALVHLYYGSRLAISAEADWTFASDQLGDRLGDLVATAGDVNGDGFSDFLAAAPSFDGDYEREGRVFLFLGAGEGPRATAGWVVESNQDGARFGASIASAGDVNGDGREEILVGAPDYDHGQIDEGLTFLFLGRVNGPSVVPDWYAESDQANAHLGSAVAGAGDVDGDGYDDVLAGAPDYDYSGYVDCGRAFLWNGSPAGAPSGNPTNAAWVGQRMQDGARFGAAAASAGDVNGDGYSDLIIGVPGHTGGEAGEGAAAIYLGSNAGPPPTPNWVTEGNQIGAAYGHSVAGAGDVNGDLYSDVIVGAPYFDNGHANEGAVHLYDGAATVPSLAPSWTAEGTQNDGHLGWSVATAGDVNGDGFSDILVGMPDFLLGAEPRGMAMSWYGSSGGLVGATPGQADWRVIGASAGARLGYCVAPAGDVDGDGYSDVLVGAPHAGHLLLTNVGLVGWERGTPDGIEVVAATIFGTQDGARFGSSAAAADVNGDGFSDILVGAPLQDEGQVDEGRSFVYYGNRGRGMARAPDQWRQDQTEPVALLGFSEAWSGFGLRAMGRTPAGRGEVRLEWEVARFGTPFAGGSIEQGATYDTGAPDSIFGSRVSIQETVEGLYGPRGWCWRLRIASRNPYFPRTPWLKPTGNGATELDLRTPESPAATEEPAGGLNALALSGRPNPFRSTASIRWMLPAAGPARVEIFDPQGRMVRRLVDGVFEAGPHQAVWDGRRNDGRPAPAGTYWIRLTAGNDRARARVVRLE